MSTGNWFYDNMMARRQAREMAAALDDAERRPCYTLLLTVRARMGRVLLPVAGACLGFRHRGRYRRNRNRYASPAPSTHSLNHRRWE